MFDFLGGSPDFTLSEAARLRRIEAKLDLIISHLGLKYEESTEFPAEARKRVEAGDKIGAIKAYRMATQAGLAEAKQAVEVYMAGR
jgi:ribosomal protein L7/L12